MKLLGLVKDPASIARCLGAAGEQTRWRRGGDSAWGPRGGAVCARPGIGATEHSRAAASERAGARSGGRRSGIAARDDAG